jgi:hypothetical protein
VNAGDPVNNDNPDLLLVFLINIQALSLIALIAS